MYNKHVGLIMYVDKGIVYGVKSNLGLV